MFKVIFYLFGCFWCWFLGGHLLEPTDTEGMTYECLKCGRQVSLWEGLEVKGEK